MNERSGSKVLRSLLRRRGVVRSLGVHDAFTALVAERAGFETLFIGGFGAAASLLGEPDLNLLTLDEMAAVVRRLAHRLSVPLVADGDTGHGGVHNVQRTVQEFERGGAAGIILEDQLSPKRCGHFAGKRLVSARDMVEKLRAAIAARRNPNFVIIARTDARDVKGLDEAVRRVNLYRRAGADVAFVESPHGEDELAEIPRRVKGPVLVNMLTGGKTANPPVHRLERWGYKIVVYPVESLMITATAVRRLAAAVLNNGSINAVRDEMISFDELKEILGADRWLATGLPGGSHVGR